MTTIRKLLAYTIIASMLLTLVPSAALSEEIGDPFSDNAVAAYDNHDNDHDHDNDNSQIAENGGGQPQASSDEGQLEVTLAEPTGDFEEDFVVGFNEVTPENSGTDELVTTTPSSDAEAGTPSSDAEVGTPSSDAEVGTPSSDAGETTPSQSTGNIVTFGMGIVGTASTLCGHDSYDCIYVSIRPTCVAIGRGNFECKECRDIQLDQIISIDPSWHAGPEVTIPAVAATCSAPGSEGGMRCSACGDISTSASTTPALGHAYDRVIRTIAPTCTNVGYTVFECSRCSDRRWRDLIPASAAGHAPQTTIERAEATCTTDGHTAEVVCTICKEVLQKTVTIQNPGHNWSIWNVIHATCEAGGERTRTCQNNASHVEKETLPKLGHDYQSVTIDPTCKAEGYTTNTCSRCGDSYMTNGIEMDSKYHVWDTTITEIEATCTKAGRTAQSECRICGWVREHSEAIPITAHKWDAGVENPAATCTTDGKIVSTCSACQKIEIETVPRLGHNWNQGVEIRATCATDGTKTYTCQNDTSHVETQLLPAPGHDYLYNVISPTCQTAGRTILTCSKCNDRTWRDLIAASPTYHAWDTIIQAREATCTEAGNTAHIECAICGKVREESVTIPVTAHKWDAGTVDPAICETDGTKTYTCDICKKTETENLPALTHSWGNWAVTSPACETDGLRSRECKNDPTHVEWETIPALGHDLQYATTAPACQTPGYTDVTCSRCGHSDQIDLVAVNPDNHTPQISKPAVEATCIVGGWTAEIECKDCGKVLQRAVATSILGPHQWGEGIITLAPSCTTDGIRTYICEVCKETKTVKEPTQGHKPDLTRPADNPSLKPTCTVAGKGSFQCSVCHETVTGVTIPALGHDWGEWKVVTPATCQAGGERIHTCKADPSHVEKEAIGKTGHAWGKWEVTPPTCLKAGQRTRICKNDPAHVEKEIVSALGHNWGAWEGTPPTCEKVGPETRTCKNDPSHVEVRFIAMTGHSWGAWVMTPPTCLSVGQKTRTCKNDPAHVETQTIPKIGHDFLSDPHPRVTAPTCVKQGYTTYACQNARCHTVYAGRYTSANGSHRYKVITMKKATKISAGYKRYACRNDGCTSEYTEILPKLGSAASASSTSSTTNTTNTSNASAANSNINTAEQIDYAVPLSSYNASTGLLSDLMLDMLNQLLGNSAFTPEILQALLQDTRIRALPLDIGELTEEGIRLPILSDGDAYLAGYMFIKPAEKDGQRGFTWTVELESGFSLSGAKILAAESIEKLILLAESNGAATFYEDGDFVPASGLIFIALWCNATPGVPEPGLYQRDQTVESLLNELIGDLAS